MAKKPDDTNEIPETLTAPWLKRFFKRKLGITVRVENASSSGWVRVWIQHYRSLDPKHCGMIYKHRFSEEFGNRCMRIVYPKSEQLREQNWGGNICSNGVAMHGRELRELLRGLLERPLAAAPVHRKKGDG